MPEKDAPFTDPDFHTTIVRVTDKAEYQNSGIKNEYAKTDLEKLRWYLLILRGNYSEWYLYDTDSHPDAQQRRRD